MYPHFGDSGDAWIIVCGGPNVCTGRAVAAATSRFIQTVAPQVSSDGANCPCSARVEIALRIRQDGSVESAEVVSGPPLLKAAALDSARQSKFECHECREALTPNSILYTFGYRTTQDCCQSQESSAATEQGAGITQSQSHITILTEPFCTCDPRADVIKVRSFKCLFLWHCGKRYSL